jgi:HD superfamily phosphohydrolase
MKLLLLIFLFLSSLSAETIQTFYGPLEVTEPVLLDLLKSPAILRLKSIHQYGVSYYTTHREEYNRYDHSLGVFALLREKGATLEEQISGLLHDVSHTAFSHVADWVFGKEYQKTDYQTLIFNFYLMASGVEEILHQHGFTIETIHPKNKSFAMLEQELPDLCADRIDYNIQGAYHQKFLTKEEALELFKNMHFENGKWVAERMDLLAKIARFSIFMTEDCWGNWLNYACSRWLADALLEALRVGLITWKDFHFGIDQMIWDQLQRSENTLIQKNLEMLRSPTDYCHLVESSQATKIVHFKCRGVDPWVKHKGKVERLTALDEHFKEELNSLRARAKEGIPIRM